jgi:hypothetical protein
MSRWAISLSLETQKSLYHFQYHLMSIKSMKKSAEILLNEKSKTLLMISQSRLILFKLSHGTTKTLVIVSGDDVILTLTDADAERAGINKENFSKTLS